MPDMVVARDLGDMLDMVGDSADVDAGARDAAFPRRRARPRVGSGWPT